MHQFVRTISGNSGDPTLGVHREYSPIIILGMHRSGTTLLCRMLESLGLFVGKMKDKNHEATFFQNINEWLINQSGGTWDNPAPIRYLLDNAEIRDQTTEYVRRYLLQSPRTISYLGWRYLRYRRVTRLAAPWGWKDPRNTFTLPLWLDIFPEAKVIHMQRSGADVALSLRRRGREQSRFQRYYRGLRFPHWVRPKRGGFVGSLRCEFPGAALALWQEYLEQASRHVAELKSRAFEVSFEALVRNPREILGTLAAFCDLPADSAAIQIAAEQVDVGVRNRFPAIATGYGGDAVWPSPLTRRVTPSGRRILG